MARTTRALFASFSPALLAVLVAACGAPHGAAPTTGDTYPERVLAGSMVRAAWSAEAGFLVSDVLAAPSGATRVGFMLDVTEGADDAPVALEARAEDGEFAPARITWVEHPIRVGYVDLGQVTRAVQVRVPAAHAEHIAHLTFSAVVPDPGQPQDVTVRQQGQAEPIVVDGVVAEVRQAITLAGVNNRASWGARNTLCTSLNETKTRISVHHTVTPTSTSNGYEQRIRGIQNYHMDSNGWCDIGYHFMVTSDGQQWEAREARWLGTHVGGQNTNNLGVSFIGCFQPGVDPCTDAAFAPVTPPQVMINGGGELIGKLANYYGITVNTSTVIGHRDNPGQTTSCPGDNLHSRLGELRAIATGTEPGPDPDPAPTVGTVQGVVWDLSITDSAGQSAELGARLPGTTITVDDGSDTTTAREGDAYWSFDLAPGFYEVTATLDGYAPATREVQVTANGEVWASIGLSPEGEAATLTVHVYDGEVGPEAAIANATVVAGQGDPVQTDGLGEAELVLAAGTVSVAVTAEGFEPLTQSIDLVAGDTPTLNFALEKLVVEDPNPEPDPEPSPGSDAGMTDPEPAPEPSPEPSPQPDVVIDLNNDRDVEQVEIPAEEDPSSCRCVTPSGDGDMSGPVLAVMMLFGLTSLSRRRRR